MFNCFYTFEKINPDTSIVTTLQNNDNQFSAYEGKMLKCFPVSGSYSGNDALYDFQLNEPTAVQFTLSSVDSMGMFLFSNLCSFGGQCIDFRETPGNWDPITMDTLVLQTGNYYLLIDKRSSSGNDSFALDFIASPDYMTSYGDIQSNDECPYDQNAIHQINFSGLTGYVEDSDRILLKFIDQNGGRKVRAEGIWRNTEILPQDNFLLLNIYADSNGGSKCGFLEGEEIIITVKKNSKIEHKDVIGTYEEENGLDDDGKFVAGGFSKITNLQTLNSAPFGQISIESANDYYSYEGGDRKYMISSNNITWEVKLEYVKGGTNWISVDEESGTQEFIYVQVEDNDGPAEREVMVQIVGSDGSKRTLTILQGAKCNPPPKALGGAFTNTWIGNPENLIWNNKPENWSLGIPPNSCHHVIIPEHICLTIPENTIIMAYTLSVNPGAMLITEDNVTFNIGVDTP